MTKESKFLNYLNLSDAYERRARFMPAALTLFILAPTAIVLGVPLLGWIKTLLAGAGIGAVCAFGMSQISSAVGNWYQCSLYPDWPYDSPTNLRLMPDSKSSSAQQRSIWHSQIKSITGLDIAKIPPEESDELRQITNDAVADLRTRLWKRSDTDRLQKQNTDYGYLRNFGGFWVAWLSFGLANVISSICASFCLASEPAWIAVSLLLFGFLCVYKFWISDTAVRAKANHYADSFYNSLSLLHSETEKQSINTVTGGQVQKSTTIE